jgi:hypothetical protein
MRDDLIAAIEPQKEAVEFLGKTLYVHELDCAADIPSGGGAVEINLRMMVLCTRDDKGELVFSDEDLPRLRKSSRRKIMPLLDAVMRVNGFDAKAEAKNSAGVPASA